MLYNDYNNIWINLIIKPKHIYYNYYMYIESIYIEIHDIYFNDNYIIINNS